MISLLTEDKQENTTGAMVTRQKHLANGLNPTQYLALLSFPREHGSVKEPFSEFSSPVRLFCSTVRNRSEFERLRPETVDFHDRVELVLVDHPLGKQCLRLHIPAAGRQLQCGQLLQNHDGRHSAFLQSHQYDAVQFGHSLHSDHQTAEEAASFLALSGESRLQSIETRFIEYPTLFHPGPRLDPGYGNHLFTTLIHFIIFFEF